MNAREYLFSEINVERQMQDALWGGPQNDDQHSARDWVAILCRHVGLSMDDGQIPVDSVRFRRQMVRVAALAVAAIESIDRRYPREKVADHISREGANL